MLVVKEQFCIPPDIDSWEVSIKIEVTSKAVCFIHGAPVLETLNSNCLLARLGKTPLNAQEIKLTQNFEVYNLNKKNNWNT